MPRSMVGLLAAVSVAMPALAAYAHGALSLLVIADGAAGAALVAYLAAASNPKKITRVQISIVLNPVFSLGALIRAVIAWAAASTGLAAYLALLEQKKPSAIQALNASVDGSRQSPAEVCRVRLGPGRWPGPRRQARRGGRGSRVNSAP